MDLLLDVNIVLDICALREGFSASAAEAVEKCALSGGRVWLYSGSVQTYDYNLRRELRRTYLNKGMNLSNSQCAGLSKAALSEFAKDKHWLAALAGEGHVFAAEDPEDEQLIRALQRFEEGTTKILTRDAALIEKCADAITPEEYLQSGPQPKSMDFIDLKTQQNKIRPQLETNIHRVLHHGQYIMGREIRELEEKLSAFVGVKHAITCASGTDALLMALMAYGIGPGDAVFTTPFTFIATAEVISLLGATPVFVDIDPDTFNLDPEKLDLAIKALAVNDPSIHPLPNNLKFKIQNSELIPRGVIAVDLFGLSADYDRINTIARKNGLFVIEDAAQSFGAEYHGKRACGLADVACTSFFPAKPLGCYGDGGALFTDDDSLADALRSIRIHGKGADKYDNVRLGINGRLDTLQAAVVLAKLEMFPQELDLRQRAALFYTEQFKIQNSKLKTPFVPAGLKSAWAQYSLLASDELERSASQKKLKEAGIPTAIYYPKPLHLQGACAALNYKTGDFPDCEECASRIFSLPMHAYLAPQEQQGTVETLFTTLSAQNRE